MAYTGVEYLDTQKLLDAANKVDGCMVKQVHLRLSVRQNSAVRNRTYII